MDVQIHEPFDVYPFLDILSNTNAFLTQHINNSVFFP